QVGELVKSSGLHQVDWRIPKAEIGYWANKRYTGQGFITEAVAAITRHGHRVMGLRRIEIIVSDRNERSWRIPERLGYTREAVLQHHRVNPDGRTDNTRLYASFGDHPAAAPWRELHMATQGAP
ncbi:MAG TPA: GNAT family protein, partial [Planctomycetota bacterium]|nr:GNAT family protein [Planctomycetota bacterium]